MAKNHSGAFFFGGVSQCFFIWGYLNTTFLHISCKNFTDLSYVGFFPPYFSCRISCSLKKIYLILFALWHGLMNLGCLSWGNVRTSWQLRSLSDTHSCRSFPKPHISSGHEVPTSEKERRTRLPSLTSVIFEWAMCLWLSLAECLNVPIAQIMSALCTNYECSSHSL